MSLNATFKADFSSFYDAVTKADTKLLDLSKGASRVESSLNRMADNFSGRKIIQDAILMEKAIRDIGGTSVLTAKELELVGAKANEAVAKLKALGQDVPQGLQNIAKEAGSVGGGLSGMLGTAGKLAGAFGIAFGVGAVVNFGKELFNAADALTKLHDKTGISVEGLQRFQVVGDEAGNTVEELARAVTMMQNRLAGGDQSAAGALDKLGLSLENIQRLQPDQQFMAISDAIREVKDPAEQVALAMDLFGKSGAEVLPSIKRGFDDVKDSAVGMSAEAVKALDDAGDAAGRLWRSTKSAIGEGLGGLINRLVDDYHSLEVLSGRFVSDSDMAAKAQAGLAAALPKVTSGVKDLTLSETEQANIERKLSEQLRVTQTQYKAHTEAVEKATTAQKKFQDSVDATTHKLKPMTELIVGGTNPAVGELDKKLFYLDSTVGDLSHKFTDKLSPGLLEAGGNMKTVESDVEDLGTKIEGHLKDSLERIPKMFIDAFTGGGGVKGALKGIGVDLLDAITKEILAPIWSAVAKWAAGIAAKFLGAFGGAGGGIGGALGSGAGVTAGLIGGAGGGGGAAAGGVGAGIGFGAGAIATGGILGAVALGGFIASTLIDQPTLSNTQGGNGMTIAEAIVAHNQLTPEEQLQEYANNNRDLYNAQVLEGSMPPGFATGSHGIRDFGGGTLAMLHGREAVLTEDQLSGVGGPQIIQVVLPDGRVLAEVVNDQNNKSDRLRSRGRAA